MSGLSVVTATFPGNLSCFPRSTFSSQSCAVEGGSEEEVLEVAVQLASDQLMKARVFFAVRMLLQWLIPLQMVSAMQLH